MEQYKMQKTLSEKEKRLHLLDEFNKSVKQGAIGLILVGSVSYASDEEVSAESDLDILVVYKDLRQCINLYFKDEQEITHLKENKYDGFLVKKKINDVAISIHNLDLEALTRIANTESGNLIYYRQAAKDITYYSTDFNRKSHAFNVVSLPVRGLMGVKRLEPISFERDGNFVIGNDIDKILSGSKVIHDTDNQIRRTISTLWLNIAERIIEHHKKNQYQLDIQNLNIADYLCRNKRFSQAVNDNIAKRTRRFLKLALNK